MMTEARMVKYHKGKSLGNQFLNEMEQLRPSHRGHESICVAMENHTLQGRADSVKPADGCPESETGGCDHLDHQQSTNVLLRDTEGKGTPYLPGYSCIRAY
ncbi:hypothetical protein LEMLEM_LOCUS16884 [Lemmus lemmus]